MQPLGFNLSQKNFTVVTENHIAHWELVRHGAGISPMPTELGDTEPAIRRILPDLGPLDSEIWLVAHRELKTSRRIRTVFDFLAAELSTYDMERLRVGAE